MRHVMTPSTTPPDSSLPDRHTGAAITTVRTDRDGVDGVQELDGVHGDLRSEAKCTGKILGSAGETGEASRLFSWAGRNSPASPVVSGRSAEIGDRVTEWPESSLLVGGYGDLRSRRRRDLLPFKKLAN